MKKYATREEFLAFSKQLIDFVKKIEAKITAEMGMLSSRYDEIVSGIKKDCEEGMARMKKEAMDYCMKMMDEMTKKEDKKMGEMESKMDAKMSEMIPPDTHEVALEASTIASGRLLPLIPKIEAIENKLPMLGLPIRDSLELLQGDERLEIKAIKDLQEKLDELKEEIAKKGRGFGGVGFSKMAWLQYVIDSETPTGTPNGVLTDFTLAGTPSSASLKVFVNGQRMKLTDDFTLSGNTITFLTAPPTGSLILCDYKI